MIYVAQWPLIRPSATFSLREKGLLASHDRRGRVQLLFRMVSIVALFAAIRSKGKAGAADPPVAMLPDYRMGMLMQGVAA